MGQKIEHNNYERLYCLWDDLSDFGIHNTDQALDYCLSTLREWLCADHAFWVGTVRMAKERRTARDPMSGWRIIAAHKLISRDQGITIPGNIIRSANSDPPPQTNCALAARAGRFRTYNLLDGKLVDLASFQRTKHFDRYYRQADISDRLWVVFPVKHDVESFFCFDKHGRRRRFNSSEKALAGQALRGIKWFHRQVTMRHGLGMCTSPLTPTERRVLLHLLCGMSERDIAQAIGVTPGSAHQYITAIFRKFSVHGRADFMSLWLQQRQ